MFLARRMNQIMSKGGYFHAFRKNIQMYTIKLDNCILEA